ncbi:MAG: hypothetical protein KC731_08730 [Myxococcales bacterium]|nr:hypothetical protein [Myxococcales bacterium]
MADADGFLWHIGSIGSDVFMGLREADGTSAKPTIQRRSEDGSHISAAGEPANIDLSTTKAEVLWIGADPFGSSGFGLHVMDPHTLKETAAVADPDAWSGATTVDGDVYWGGVGGVRRASLESPTGYDDVLPLARTGDVVVTGEWLVAHDLGDQGMAAGIWVARLDGSQAAKVAEGFILAFLETDENGWVYFSQLVDEKVSIVRFRPPTGDLQSLVSGDLRGDFVVDRGWLYAYFADQGLVRLPIPKE